MSDQDRTRETDGPSQPDPAPPTRLPSTDSLQTRAPSSYPDTRDDPEPFEASIPTRIPVASEITEDYDGPASRYRDGPPDAFPGYELLETLGEGGMGVVYKARQEGLNRPVALKVILGGRRAGPKDLIRFLAEAEAVASIKHPHVVQVHEYGEADGRPFLAMEYLPGGTLADRLEREGRLDPGPAAELLAKLARAVQAAHDQGIVHRDLKPANVLFDAEGEPKVTDFGLAKRAHGTELTRTQAVMGTPAYMSPEQARGETKFVGPPADVYALGVILYECLTGTRPFVQEDTDALLCRVMFDDPEPPRRHVPGLPRDLELIALKCLAKDPADRYPTAADLTEDLAHFAAGEPVSVRAASTIERALKWAKRKPTQAAAYALTVAVIILLAFGASLAVLWQEAEGDRADVEIAREKLERLEYGRAMQIAHQEWRENNVVASVTLLQDTKPELRGWEWYYVSKLCHSELMTLKGHTGRVDSAEFSPDGSHILTTSDDNTARVWDAKTGAQTLTLKGLSKHLYSAGFSPDGSRIVTTCQDNTARVWDAKTGAQTLTLKEPSGPLTWASFSPDGSRIVTSSNYNTATVWDAKTGDETLSLAGHRGHVAWASFSPDGSRIVTASVDRTVRVWDAKTGTEALMLKGHTSGVNSASFSPDGSRIVTSSDDNTARVWDATTSAEATILKGHTEAVYSAEFNPDGSRILTTSDDNTAKVWDAQTGAETLTLKGHTGPVIRASFSANGSRIATISKDNTARVWDATTGTEALTLKEPSGRVFSAEFSPDGSRILTTSTQSTARVWDATTGAETLTLKGHTGLLTYASFSSDGSRIVTASVDRTARVWDAKTGAETLTLNWHSGRVLSAEFSPDGLRILTTSDDSTARIWDATTGAETLTLEGHTGPVNTVSFSPDGSRIVTTCDDRRARVWDAKTGAQTLTLKGHTGPVHSASFSPDGSRIVTSSTDDTTRVWDTKSGAETLTLKWHSNWHGPVSFSPDGSRIVTRDSDNTARVWDAGPECRKFLAGKVR